MMEQDDEDGTRLHDNERDRSTSVHQAWHVACDALSAPRHNERPSRTRNDLPADGDPSVARAMEFWQASLVISDFVRWQAARA
jgi:hypothetical protein